MPGEEPGELFLEKEKDFEQEAAESVVWKYLLLIPGLEGSPGPDLYLRNVIEPVPPGNRVIIKIEGRIF
jgi:hypothetical protein